MYRNRILEAWLAQLYPGGGAPGIPAHIGDDVEFYVRDFIDGCAARRLMRPPRPSPASTTAPPTSP